MACDTQYSKMSTGSLHCLGKNNKSAHVEWRCLFFFFLFVDDMLIESMTTEYTDMEGWLSVTLFFDLLTHEFSSGSVSWPLSEDGAMLRHFPRAGRCSLLSPLSHFLPEFAFYLTIHPHRFGFYVNTEGPRMSSLDHHWLQNQGTSLQDGHRAPPPISGLTAVYSWDYSRSVVVLPSWILSCIF